jgi:5S rRNA maturation endonuclease (ribonuclease M5)
VDTDFIDLLSRYQDVPVIVEGQKDKIALEKLGFANIICLHGPISQFCEDVAQRTKRVCILTDLDREGRKLYSQIKANLERNGVRIDDSLRDKIWKTKITQIEGLDDTTNDQLGM